MFRRWAIDDIAALWTNEVGQVIPSSVRRAAQVSNRRTVNLNWYYSGSSSEADVRRAILEAINDAAVDEEFEINDLIGKIKRMGASTVYVRDGERESGRRAPLAIVVYHTQKRTVEARIVTDFLQTSRLQRFIPDSIRITRISG